MKRFGGIELLSAPQVNTYSLFGEGIINQVTNLILGQVNQSALPYNPAKIVELFQIHPVQASVSCFFSLI